jgi:hypothetical protein
MNDDEPLQLRDFVAKTIKQVIDGVATAQQYATNKKAIINPKPEMHRVPAPQSISFDVAITAAKGTQTQGGIALAAS